MLNLFYVFLDCKDPAVHKTNGNVTQIPMLTNNVEKLVVVVVLAMVGVVS